MKEKEDKQFITKSTLMERGWTQSIINKLNLVPDKEVNNPRYSSSSKMKLYEISKVEYLESTVEFKNLLEKSNKRKLSSAKAVETKMQKMKDYVHNIKIELPDCSTEMICEAAVNHYNEFHDAKSSWYGYYNNKWIDNYKKLDTSTLIRLVSNMIRHTMTEYDEVLEKNYGKVGIDYAHDYLKDKITQMVKDRYFNN